MNITHTWIIKKLNQINDGTGTVTSVFFKVVSRDEDTSKAVCYPDSVILDTQNIDSDNFIPYSELTEEQVLQFVRDKLGDEVQMIEDSNALQIQNKVNPPNLEVISENLPWS
jgi:hypothetical protein